MSQPIETTVVSALTTQAASNTRICRDHACLILIAPGFPDSEPGQFVQISCCSDVQRDPHCVETTAEGWPKLTIAGGRDDDQAYLRRPFSIGGHDRDEQGRPRLTIISRTVGQGTAWLEGVKPGDTVNITGPLGHGFRISDEDRPLVLIGGGVGIPPLQYLARRLHQAGKRDVVCFFGATTRDLLPLKLLAEPEENGEPTACVELGGGAEYPVAITTDDGSAGLRGFTTDALNCWLDKQNISRAAAYACGPEPMLAAVSRITRDRDLECQLCIERMMGCGLGGCLSCIVRVHDDARPDKQRWALTCKDGPVFDRDDLVEGR